MKRLNNKKPRTQTRSSLKEHTGVLIKLAFSMIICFSLGISQLFAQEKTISGKVVDETGEPLPGVNVIIKGSSTGTITTLDGTYLVTIDAVDAALVFSYIGYLDEEIPVGAETTIDVTLLPDIQGLDEVVVVGYTTKKRGELTGSVSTVSSEDLQNTSNNDLTKSLSGKVAGLIIQDRGGYPGSTDDDDFTMLIRGQATLNNNKPLIVIDGVPANSFSHLAPSDIASLSVLKDGAAAIYGARAANGVIVITTNRGKSGKMEVNLNSSFKWSQFTRMPNMMNSEQYAIYKNEINERIGLPPAYSDEEIENYRNPDNLMYPSTDWVGLVFREFAPEQRHSLSLSGGSEKVRYFVSGDYIDQGGLYASDILEFKQWQVRSNIDMQLHKRFKVGLDISGNKNVRKEPSVSKNEIYKATYQTQPNVVGIYDNGLVAKARENGNNPVMLSSPEAGYIDYDNSTKQTKLSFDWDLGRITEGLSVTGFGHYKIYNEFRKTFRNVWETYEYNERTGEYDVIPSFFSENTISAEDWQRTTDSYQLNAQINYNRSFTGGHTVRGFIAYEQAAWDQRWYSAYGKDLISDDHPSLFAAGTEGMIINGKTDAGSRVNYFGSFSYGYKGKYLADFTLRYDGSQNFPEGNRFGAFPSLSLGWVITEEGFMTGVKDNWLSNLKLRASWAVMGNDRVAQYQYLSRYTYGGVRVGNTTGDNGNNWDPNFYVFGESPVLYNTFYESVLANPNITWETSNTTNIGLTFALFESKLSGDLNYFYEKRSDILVARTASVPDYAGITNLPSENFGEVENSGIEFQLAYNNRIGEFNYNIGGNFTYVKNNVVFIDEAANVPEWQKREGKPIGGFLYYPTNGIYADEEAVANDPDAIAGTLEGDIDYIDTDENGTIDANDRIRGGSSAVPEIQYGIFANFEWKGIALNILFQGQARSEIEIYYSGDNRPAFWFENRWTPENRNSTFPRAFERGDPYNAKDISYSNNVNQRSSIDTYIFDASFIRLKEVELSYTIPKNLISWLGLRIYARGSNLFTIDNIGWVDPEMPAYHDFSAGRYPPLRSYTIGLNATF